MRLPAAARWLRSPPRPTLCGEPPAAAACARAAACAVASCWGPALAVAINPALALYLAGSCPALT